MKKALPLAAAVLACGIGSIASAAQLYSETFSTDGAVSTYVGAGQVFTSATSVSSMPGASGGVLTLGYLQNIGADNVGCVATSLGGNQALVSMKFDVTPRSYSAGSFRLIAGNTSDIVWVGWDVPGRSWANIYINDSGISVQGGAALPFTMNQNHTLSVFFNDSGASQSYTGPDGSTSYTLNDNSYSVFDGTTALAQSVAKGSGVADISYVGLLIARNWSGAQTLTDIDNVVIRDDVAMYPVPEPTSLAVLAVGGMLVLRRSRR